MCWNIAPAPSKPQFSSPASPGNWWPPHVDAGTAGSTVGVQWPDGTDATNAVVAPAGDGGGGATRSAGLARESAAQRRARATAVFRVRHTPNAAKNAAVLFTEPSR